MQPISRVPGKNSIQGAASMDWVPSAISVPQLVLGSAIPKPKKLMKLSASMIAGRVRVVQTRRGSTW